MIYAWVGFIVVWAGGLALAAFLVHQGLKVAFYYAGKWIIGVELWRDLLREIVKRQQARNGERSRKKKPPLACRVFGHKWGIRSTDGGQTLHHYCERCEARRND